MPRMAESDGTTGQSAAAVAKTDEAAFANAMAPRPARAEASTRQAQSTCGTETDRMICERCGKAEMYRMHAVWRCPECGFKTDCCGW
jgi:predicted RNA-binding Zn-ribbon protein involved in translation (DUF1610 family)